MKQTAWNVPRTMVSVNNVCLDLFPMMWAIVSIALIFIVVFVETKAINVNIVSVTMGSMQMENVQNVKTQTVTDVTKTFQYVCNVIIIMLWIKIKLVVHATLIAKLVIHRTTNNVGHVLLVISD